HEGPAVLPDVLEHSTLTVVARIAPRRCPSPSPSPGRLGLVLIRIVAEGIPAAARCHRRSEQREQNEHYPSSIPHVSPPPSHVRPRRRRGAFGDVFGDRSPTVSRKSTAAGRFTHTRPRRGARPGSAVGATRPGRALGGDQGAVVTSTGSDHSDWV